MSLPGIITVGAQHSPGRPSFPKVIWLNQFLLSCIFCLLISLQSFTAWPEVIPSPPVVSLLHLQDSVFPSVPMLQSEPPFLHTPQAGNFNSVFIHFYQKMSCTQGICFFPLSPKLSLDCEWTPEEAAQGGCGVSILGDIQNLTGHGPEQPACSHPALHRGLDRWSPEVPASPILWVAPETPMHCLQPAVCENAPLCCGYRPAEGMLPALRLFLWLARRWRSQALGFSDAEQLELPPPFFKKTDGFYDDCR